MMAAFISRLRERLRSLPSLRDVNQAVIGVIAVAMFIAAALGAFAYGALDLTANRYALSAVFPSTGGIGRGADVRVAGVSVGEVSGVEPDFDVGQVVVRFEVDHGVDLGPATRAEIASATLLGGYYLRLSGPIEEPFLEDLPGPDPRRRIPLERTTAPLSLVGTLSDTTRQVQALDIDAINDVLAQLAGATDRNKELVPQLIHHLTAVGAAIQERDAQLRDLVQGGQRIAGTLAERDAEIGRLVDAADVLLQTLSDRRDQLASVLGNGSEAVAKLTATITEHRAAIDGILADAHVLLDGVDRRLADLNTGLAYAGPVFKLLGAVAGPEGGFDVSVEGFVTTLDQLRGLLSLLFPEIRTP
jgi:phospholipid/cholesterol/gamma-HCH transport system substrate-binding protein